MPTTLLLAPPDLKTERHLWMVIIPIENSYLILEKENYTIFNFILCKFLVRMIRYF